MEFLPDAFVAAEEYLFLRKKSPGLLNNLGTPRKLVCAVLLSLFASCGTGMSGRSGCPINKWRISTTSTNDPKQLIIRMEIFAAGGMLGNFRFIDRKLLVSLRVRLRGPLASPTIGQ